MKRGVRLAARSGGNAVMLGLFWVGAALIGSSMAINYTMNRNKFSGKNDTNLQHWRNLT